MQNLKIMNRSSLLASSVLTVLLLVAVATSAFADTAGRKEAQRQVAEQLSDFKRTAFEMRREADALSVVNPEQTVALAKSCRQVEQAQGSSQQPGEEPCEP
jgi:hypothetical protein